MKTRPPVISLALLIYTILSACGLSPMVLDTQATQTATGIVVTQTAEVPTPTLTLIDRQLLEPITPANVEKLVQRAILSSSCSSGPIRSIAFNLDEPLLAVGSQPNPVVPSNVCVWDLITGAERVCLEGYSTMALSPDGMRLALGRYDGVVQLWDIAAGQTVLTLEEALARGGGGTYEYSDPDRGLSFSGVWNVNAIWSLAFSPDGVNLAVGRGDPWVGPGTLELYDVATGKRLFEFKPGATPACCRMVTTFDLAFNPDGTLLASANGDGSVRLWDPVTGREKENYDGLSQAHSVAFSPDGTLLVSGMTLSDCDYGENCYPENDQGEIRLWDVGMSKQPALLLGPAGGISDVAISPDGRILVSVGHLGGVWLWDIESQTILTTIDLQNASSVAFSPDRKLLIVGSWDGVIQLWGVLSK